MRIRSDVESAAPIQPPASTTTPRPEPLRPLFQATDPSLASSGRSDTSPASPHRRTRILRCFAHLLRCCNHPPLPSPEPQQFASSFRAAIIGTGPWPLLRQIRRRTRHRTRILRCWSVVIVTIRLSQVPTNCQSSPRETAPLKDVVTRAHRPSRPPVRPRRATGQGIPTAAHLLSSSGICRSSLGP